MRQTDSGASNLSAAPARLSLHSYLVRHHRWLFIHLLHLPCLCVSRVRHGAARVKWAGGVERIAVAAAVPLVRAARCVTPAMPRSVSSTALGQLAEERKGGAS